MEKRTVREAPKEKELSKEERSKELRSKMDALKAKGDKNDSFMASLHAVTDDKRKVRLFLIYFY